MNNRPWPLDIHEIPQLNPNASGPTELNYNFEIVNNLIREFNNLKNPKKEQKQRRPAEPPSEEGGGGTEIYPYDGVPGHNDVPWVITNGVLINWPKSTFIVGASLGAGLTIDVVNRICYPNRLVIPSWAP